MASGLVMQLWRSYLVGLGTGLAATEGVALPELDMATSGMYGKTKMFQAIKMISGASGLTPGQKVDLTVTFLRRMGFYIKPGGVIETNGHLIIENADSGYKLMFLSSGQILYGKLSSLGEWVWTAL
jgi:hypothetical protein